MFDIGWSEMVFVLVIAVLVIGPKDLPKAISTVGRYVRKARSMARDFQSGINDLARETELDEIKNDIQKGTDFNIKKQIEDAVDPTGSGQGMFNDIKPEIRDPRDSANNYSAPPSSPTPSSKGEDVAEASPKPDAPAETPAPSVAAKAPDVPTEPKSETKAS